MRNLSTVLTAALALSLLNAGCDDSLEGTGAAAENIPGDSADGGGVGGGGGGSDDGAWAPEPEPGPPPGLEAPAGPEEPEPPAEPEPPEQPEPPPEMCVDEGPTSLYLSADDSNSQASPVLARHLIASGRYVPDSIVRTYEFLNYADFTYTPPAEGVAIHPEMRPVPDEDGQYSLQIGVRAPDVLRADLPPMNLVLVLDGSGSMAGRPMALLRQSVRGLFEHLRPVDTVSIVRLDAASAVLVDGQAPSAIDLDAVLGELQPSGVTDVEAALRLAYERAVDHASAERLSRIVLFSDGGANAGELSEELIAEHAGSAEEEGIYLVGVGLGEGYDDGLMDAVTDAGKGAYFFIDRPAEAERMFGERFVANMAVAALDVQVNLVLPPTWSMIVFHGEEISGDPAEVEPQNLAPNDQMIFSQVIGTCAPDEVTGEEQVVVRVRYTVPGEDTPRMAESTLTVAELLDAPAPNLGTGDALVAFAEGLKALYPLRFGPVEEVDALCADLRADLAAAPDTEAVIEARALAEQACAITREGEVHADACDCGPEASFATALGVCGRRDTQRLHGPEAAARAVSTLNESTAIKAREGCRMAALSTGRVGEAETIPGQARSCGDGGNDRFADPAPPFQGARRTRPDDALICDLAQMQITVTAPDDARSFSFDFNYFSAEYPEYIGSEFNDTFYAILEAPSTNGGQRTNIAFDAVGKAIEINNNYFAHPFHPCSEAGTGFTRRASTCWLRTSWPIMPGETFTLTFSVHDEGDAIYSSTVLLDNFQFHTDTAVGMTDPLN